MRDILTQLAELRRPRLLIRTARIALREYRRETRLPRILGSEPGTKSGQVILKLMCLEETLNDKRKSGDASYSAAAHVDIVTALMAEAQLYRTQIKPEPLT